MLNHPSQSPSYHGRYPRTLEEGFGTGARLTPKVAGTRLQDALACALIGAAAIGVFAGMGLLLAWRG